MFDSIVKLIIELHAIILTIRVSDDVLTRFKSRHVPNLLLEFSAVTAFDSQVPSVLVGFSHKNRGFGSVRFFKIPVC